MSGQQGHDRPPAGVDLAALGGAWRAGQAVLDEAPSPSARAAVRAAAEATAQATAQAIAARAAAAGSMAHPMARLQADWDAQQALLDERPGEPARAAILAAAARQVQARPQPLPLVPAEASAASAPPDAASLPPGVASLAARRAAVAGAQADVRADVRTEAQGDAKAPAEATRGRPRRTPWPWALAASLLVGTFALLLAERVEQERIDGAPVPAIRQRAADDVPAAAAPDPRDDGGSAGVPGPVGGASSPAAVSQGEERSAERPPEVAATPRERVAPPGREMAESRPKAALPRDPAPRSMPPVADVPAARALRAPAAPAPAAPPPPAPAPAPAEAAGRRADAGSGPAASTGEADRRAATAPLAPPPTIEVPRAEPTPASTPGNPPLPASATDAQTRRAAERIERRGQAGATATSAPGETRSSVTDGASRPLAALPTSAERGDPGLWFGRIEALRAAGRREEADAEWRQLQARYPGFVPPR